MPVAVAASACLLHDDMNNVQKAIEVLKAGGVVVFPTETSYGIGCDATNAKAVRRVFRLKGRAEGRGTPLIVSSLAMAKQYGVFSKTALALAKAHWPGPLTLVIPVFARSKTTKQSNERLLRSRQARSRNDITRDVLENATVGLRVSSHPIARALARGLGRPIVATSANRAGEPAAFHPDELPQWKDIFIVDAGRLPKAPPSTLVRVSDNAVEILRQGSVKILHRNVTR